LTTFLRIKNVEKKIKKNVKKREKRDLNKKRKKRLLHLWYIRRTIQLDLA